MNFNGKRQLIGSPAAVVVATEQAKDCRSIEFAFATDTRGLVNIATPRRSLKGVKAWSTYWA